MAKRAKKGRSKSGYWGRVDGLARLRNALAQVRDGVEGELREIAEEVLQDAKARAPLDTGELVESGYLEEKPGGYFEVGFRAQHAAVQHERLDYEHPQGGEPKYLERALDEAASKVEERLAAAAREVLRE